MYSLLAIMGVFFGLLLIPAVPPLGAAMFIGGMVMGGKAIQRADDLEALLGAFGGIVLVFAAWQFIGWIFPSLALP